MKYCKRYRLIKQKLIKSGFKIQTNGYELLMYKRYKLFYYEDAYFEFRTGRRLRLAGF